jgi:hypothetical protein
MDRKTEAQLWEAILALCARVEALEGKYETQHLATLEWGKDVDFQSRLIDRIWKRIETLEAAQPGCPHIRSSDEGTSYCELAEATP